MNKSLICWSHKSLYLRPLSSSSSPLKLVLHCSSLLLRTVSGVNGFTLTDWGTWTKFAAVETKRRVLWVRQVLVLVQGWEDLESRLYKVGGRQQNIPTTGFWLSLHLKPRTGLFYLKCVEWLTHLWCAWRVTEPQISPWSIRYWASAL